MYIDLATIHRWTDVLNAVETGLRYITQVNRTALQIFENIGVYDFMIVWSVFVMHKNIRY